MKYSKLILTLFFLTNQVLASTWSVVGADEKVTQSIIHQITDQTQFLNQLDNNQFEKQITEIVRSILQPEGYYNSTIKIDPNNKYLIKISLNQPIRISQIRFTLPQAINNPEFIRKVNHLTNPFQKERFTLDHYEKIKSIFLKLCKEHGYLNASILDTTAHIDTSSQTASIHLKVKLGSQYLFKSFKVHQLPYSVSLIERFGDLHPDTAFQPEKVDTLNNNLLRSGLFKTVEVKTEINDINKTATVHVSGTPIKATNWSISLGFNEVSNVNLTYKNTLNRLSQEADQLTTQFSLMMPNRSSANFPLSTKLNYTRPGINPLTDFWSLLISADHLLSIAGRLLERSQASINYHRSYPFDNFDVSLNLQHEKILTPITNTNTLLYPSISTHHIRSQSDYLPYDRTRIRSTTSFGVTTASDKQYFLRFHAGLRGAIDLDSKFTIYQDLALESLFSNQFQNLPTNILIHIGGAYTLRGYENQSIGRSDNLPPTWLNHVFLYSHELAYHLNETYSIGAFIDSALTYETDQSIKNYHSFGLSGNMSLPMGLLQISAGKAAAKNTGTLIQIRFIPGLRTLD